MNTTAKIPCAARSDAELLDAWANLKCQDSFRILHDRYDRKLHLFLIRRYRMRKCDRDDLSQVIWLCVVSKHARYDHKKQFVKWFMAIAAYRAINFLKRHGSMRRRTGEFSELKNISDPGIDERAVLQRDSESLSDALELLCQPCRGAITAVYVDGLAVCDVATMLGVTERTVQRRLVRAKDELKSLMAA